MAMSPRANAPAEQWSMPIFRYFVFVGGALLALLLVVNYSLSEAPVAQAAATAGNETAANDLPLIRIRSDRKLPERVVLDTSRPAITPPAVKIAEAPQPPAQSGASPELAEISAKARVRETFAQFVPPEAKNDKNEATAVKNAEAKPSPHPKRKIARTRSPSPPYYGQPMIRVAQQPHFGPFNMTW
jgi:hypothetical protein